MTKLYRILLRIILVVPFARAMVFFLGRKVTARFQGIFDELAGVMPYQRLEEPTWTPSGITLSQSKVAILTTAGFFVKGQAPFKESSLRGDFGYRVLHKDLPISRLSVGKRFIDRSLVLLDPNILFPIDRLKELREEGIIGEVATYHYSFSGYCMDKNYLISGSARSVARRLRYEAVDKVVVITASLLTQENAVLIQRTIEEEGIPTVSLLYTRDAVTHLRPPRACLLNRNHSLFRMEEYLDHKRQTQTLVALLKQFDQATYPGFCSDVSVKEKKREALR